MRETRGKSCSHSGERRGNGRGHDGGPPGRAGQGGRRVSAPRCSLCSFSSLTRKTRKKKKKRRTGRGEAEADGGASGQGRAQFARKGRERNRQTERVASSGSGFCRRAVGPHRLYQTHSRRGKIMVFFFVNFFLKKILSGLGCVCVGLFRISFILVPFYFLFHLRR